MTGCITINDGCDNTSVLLKELSRPVSDVTKALNGKCLTIYTECGIIDFINENVEFDKMDTLFLEKCVRLAFPRDTPPEQSKRRVNYRRLREPLQNINKS